MEILSPSFHRDAGLHIPSPSLPSDVTSKSVWTTGVMVSVSPPHRRQPPSRMVKTGRTVYYVDTHLCVASVLIFPFECSIFLHVKQCNWDHSAAIAG